MDQAVKRQKGKWWHICETANRKSEDKSKVQLHTAWYLNNVSGNSAYDGIPREHLYTGFYDLDVH